MVNVGGQGSSRLKESIIRERRAVDITHIGSQCELSLKIPGMYSIYLIYFFLWFAIRCTNNVCRRKKKKKKKCLKGSIRLSVHICLRLLSVVSPTTSLTILSLMMVVSF
jgi:hypothetical protein